MEVYALGMRSLIALSLCVTSLHASAQSRERLVGFGTEQEIAVVATDGADSVVKVCALNDGELNVSWLSVVDGTRCAALTEAAAGEAVAVAVPKLVDKAKPSKAAPWGLKVSVASVDGKHTVTVTGGGELSATVESTAPLKLAETLWNAEGTFAAVALEEGAKGERKIVLLDVRKALTGAAGKKVAAERLKQAQAAMKKRDWSTAKERLERAQESEPNSVVVRYTRAQAEAQAGIGTTSMLEALRWLKEASLSEAPHKKDAVRALEQAKSDHAFDAWAGEPELRELIGLPKTSEMTPDARLLERSAVFSRQGRTCQSSWLTLAFTKGGKGTLTIADSCKGKKTQTKQPFTWSVADGVVKMTTAARAAGDDALPATGTLELDATYQQLRWTSDGVSAIGPFEPGPALIDDSL